MSGWWIVLVALVVGGWLLLAAGALLRGAARDLGDDPDPAPPDEQEGRSPAPR